MRQENYPAYDALWPLISMGVLKSDYTPNGWAVKTGSSRQTRVAAIDTSVAVEHPNLEGAINTHLAFDLFSTRLGAFPYRDKDDKVGALQLNTSTNVASGQEHSSRLLAELIDRLSADSTCWLNKVTPTNSPDFSSHGTAICGLVGGRPAKVEAAAGHPSPLPDKDIVPLPFTGVDPSCEIVPISTNFDPSPEALILAFLYAELINPDVVLVPRTIPDPTRTIPELTDTIGDDLLRDLVSPVDLTLHDLEAWDELAQLISNISLVRPIVCAGGNGQEDEGIYPANLASEHNGIIAVGALNAKGHRSAYAPMRNMTVVGPSDDSEVFDRTEVRLDERDAEYSPVGVPIPNSNFKFSHFEIISTDVPGRFGYSGSPFASVEPSDGLREFGSYFCRFGGTSASSAFVAGFLALAKSCGELADYADGMDAKAWLVSRSATVTDAGDEYLYPVWSGAPSFPDKDTGATGG